MGETRRTRISLAGFSSIVFAFYIYTSILLDLAYAFMPDVADAIYNLLAAIAGILLLLTLLLAIREKDWPVILLFMLFFLVIGGAALGWI